MPGFRSKAAGRDLPSGGCRLEPAGCDLDPVGLRLKPAGIDRTPAGWRLKPAGIGRTSAGCEPKPAGFEPIPGGFKGNPGGIDPLRNSASPPLQQSKTGCFTNTKRHLGGRRAKRGDSGNDTFPLPPHPPPRYHSRPRHPRFRLVRGGRPPVGAETGGCRLTPQRAGVFPHAACHRQT